MEGVWPADGGQPNRGALCRPPPAAPRMRCPRPPLGPRFALSPPLMRSVRRRRRGSRPVPRVVHRVLSGPRCAHHVRRGAPQPPSGLRRARNRLRAPRSQGRMPVLAVSVFRSGNERPLRPHVRQADTRTRRAPRGCSLHTDRAATWNWMAKERTPARTLRPWSPMPVADLRSLRRRTMRPQAISQALLSPAAPVMRRGPRRRPKRRNSSSAGVAASTATWRRTTAWCCRPTWMHLYS